MAAHLAVHPSALLSPSPEAAPSSPKNRLRDPTPGQLIPGNGRSSSSRSVLFDDTVPADRPAGEEVVLKLRSRRQSVLGGRSGTPQRWDPTFAHSTVDAPTSSSLTSPKGSPKNLRQSDEDAALDISPAPGTAKPRPQSASNQQEQLQEQRRRQQQQHQQQRPHSGSSVTQAQQRRSSSGTSAQRPQQQQHPVSVAGGRAGKPALGASRLGNGEAVSVRREDEATGNLLGEGHPMATRSSSARMSTAGASSSTPPLALRSQSHNSISSRGLVRDCIVDSSTHGVGDVSCRAGDADGSDGSEPSAAGSGEVSRVRGSGGSNASDSSRRDGSISSSQRSSSNSSTSSCISTSSASSSSSGSSGSGSSSSSDGSSGSTVSSLRALCCSEVLLASLRQRLAADPESFLYCAPALSSP